MDKIYFNLPSNQWHGFDSESLWGQKIYDNLYEIRNVPFYVQGVSFGDYVKVENIEGLLWFRSTFKSSGHSTYRVILNKDVSITEFRSCWEGLEQIGCTYEQGEGRLVAIDVHSNTDIFKAYNLLEIGEQKNIWNFEEAHCGHNIN